ncbi:DltD N-terminal domain protein [Astrocystis sublimbata]|nr:DltD N-terminal domain protein [Astrocystis sublimbata]
MPLQKEEIEFKTLDGLTLRGTLYVAGHKKPAVIMTPGFNTTRDMLLPKIAEHFQVEGITALVYDPRSVGSSDGTPRNNIDPARQVEDYHDALTMLKSDARIDSDKIVYWGLSLSGTVALAAAAMDKRAKAIVAVCPLTGWELGPQWRGVTAKAMQDRESRLRGNSPLSIPMLTENGKNPAGWGPGSSAGKEGLSLMMEAQAMVPLFRPHTTLQTYYNIMAWAPFKVLPFISPTPVLMIIPHLDVVSPPEKQKELIYDMIEGPKEMVYLADKGHMDVLDGQSFEPTMQAQSTKSVNMLCVIDLIDIDLIKGTTGGFMSTPAMAVAKSIRPISAA